MALSRSGRLCSCPKPIANNHNSTKPYLIFNKTERKGEKRDHAVLLPRLRNCKLQSCWCVAIQYAAQAVNKKWNAPIWRFSNILLNFRFVVVLSELYVGSNTECYHHIYTYAFLPREWRIKCMTLPAPSAVHLSACKEISWAPPWRPMNEAQPYKRKKTTNWTWSKLHYVIT